MSQLITPERLIILGAFLYIVHLAWQKHKKRIKSWFKDQKAKLPRRWKPKSPHDCHDCCNNVQLIRPHTRVVQPWTARKSTRGRKKSISTQGFACFNRQCDYFGIKDETIHALVADGKRSGIQYFKCQCCGKSASSRKGTPLYYLKRAQSDIFFALFFLAEGIDISALHRYAGFAEATLTRWLNRMGLHSKALHDVFFHDLSFDLIQLDEMHCRVRNSSKSRWIWFAIDPLTKTLPTLHVGGRKAIDAYTTLHDLHLRLNTDSIPVFTSDGLRLYFFAITAHFGFWDKPRRARVPHWFVHPNLHYGQLIKRMKNRKLAFSFTRMVCGKRSELNRTLDKHGMNEIIQTAYVERVNLTARQSVAPLTRKT